VQNDREDELLKLVTIFKDYNKLDTLKVPIDQDTEQGLLHICANKKKPNLMRILVEVGQLNVNAKDVVSYNLTFSDQNSSTEPH